MVTSDVKIAVKVIHNVVRRSESLADHFAMEDRLEAKSNAHAAEFLERATARLECITTDPNPAKATAIEDKLELIKKRATAPSEGPAAWTQRDFERLLEVSVLDEPRHLAQRCLGAEHRIRRTRLGVKVRATLVRQLEWIQDCLRWVWTRRREMAAEHRAAVAAAAAAAGAATNN